MSDLSVHPDGGLFLQPASEAFVFPDIMSGYAGEIFHLAQCHYALYGDCYGNSGASCLYAAVCAVHPAVYEPETFFRAVDMDNVRPDILYDMFQPFQNECVLSRPWHKQPFETEYEVVSGTVRGDGMVFYPFVKEFFLPLS